MTEKLAHMRWYPSDWLGSTARALMTPVQRACYLDLLFHAWGLPGCTLPDDDDALRALGGVVGMECDLRIIRMQFTSDGNGGLVNDRQLTDWLADQSRREKWRKSGAKGGSRQAKGRLKAPLRQPQGTLNHPTPTPTPTPNSKDSCSSGEAAGMNGVAVAKKAEINRLNDRFEKTWAIHPKKRAKADALKAWLALKPDDDLCRVIYQDIKRRSEIDPQWTRDDGQYIPLFATYIRGKRWTDAIETELPLNGHSIDRILPPLE